MKMLEERKRKVDKLIKKAAEKKLHDIQNSVVVESENGDGVSLVKRLESNAIIEHVLTTFPLIPLPLIEVPFQPEKCGQEVIDARPRPWGGQL